MSRKPYYVDEEKIYDGAISALFHEYFDLRGEPLTDGGYKKIASNVFQGAFLYIYKNLFRPPEDGARNRRQCTSIDLDDYILLDRIVDEYKTLCLDYNIKSSLQMFCEMTGIHRDTIHSWKAGDTRSKMYFTAQGEPIQNIQAFIVNNPGARYEEKLSPTYSDIAKKLEDIGNDTQHNVTNDTQVGTLMISNKSTRYSELQFEKTGFINQAIARRMLSTADIELVKPEELPGSETQFGGGKLEIPD